jgi:ribonuclease E
VGQGLLEAYSEPCPTCGGRGHTIELPGLGGIKPKAKPIPRPPLARPVEDDGEPSEATDDEEPSMNGLVSPDVEKAVEAIEAAESGDEEAVEGEAVTPGTAAADEPAGTDDGDDPAQDQAAVHSADVLVE